MNGSMAIALQNSAVAHNMSNVSKLPM